MTKPPRFFIDPSQVTGDRIAIAGDDLRHIRTVLRMRLGDRLTVLDGKGGEYLVSIAGLRKDEISTTILDRVQREIEGPRVILGQGLPKSDKMDLIVQKATELGVSSIVPLITERTIVKVRDGERRVGRWQRIAREAAMQSHRSTIPLVREIMSYQDFLGDPLGVETALYPPMAGEGQQGGMSAETAPITGSLFLMAWEEGTEAIKDVLRSYPGARTVVVLIGPEGGFSLNEAAEAKEKGFRAVSLGPTILRTETAAVAMLSMIGYELRE